MEPHVQRCFLSSGFGGDGSDDIAPVAVAKHLEYVELYSWEAVSAMKAWFDSTELALAREKTEAILITKPWKRNFTRIIIGSYITTFKLAIKYVAMMIEAKLNFKQYLEYTYIYAKRDPQEVRGIL